MLLIGMLSLIILILGINVRQLLLSAKNRDQLQLELSNLKQNLDALSIRFDERDRHSLELRDSVMQLLHAQQQEQQQQRQRFDEHQFRSLKTFQESLQMGMGDVRQQLMLALQQHAEMLSKRFDNLTQQTDQRLQQISGQVEKRLSEGFEKTTATFIDIVKRLALIDEAQKKITELSTNVVNLQEILADKSSRGTFGEVQLAGLIQNMMPESHFSLQYTLSNGKRADCILFLPEPTNNVVIDAKFPLENYRRMLDLKVSDIERQQSSKQFQQDVLKHIHDISSKYIIPGETADGAVMFIPAEAIFAEIHAHYPNLVETAQRSRVWLASPTTLMAILTTARAVLKDAATRQQVHIIRDHLIYLSKDFSRFQQRLNKLAEHISQAHEDALQVKISSQKITSRFNKIEKVELDSLSSELSLENLGEAIEE